MNMPFIPLQKQPHWQPNPFAWILLIISILLFVAMFIGVARAEEIDMQTIMKIESNGNPNAVSYRGAKYGRGLYQISEIALKDYNQWHRGSEIALISLYNPVEAQKVAEWYISYLKRILAKKGIPAQNSLLLISWNWGIGNCVKWYRQGADYNKLPKETRNYLKKYHALIGKHN